MKSICLHGTTAVLLALATLAPASALDYKAIGAAPALLYDAPSLRGKKVFVAPRNMPVEVILTYGEWTKVRDAAGDLSWIESKLLVPRRYVVVKAAAAKLRSAAEESAVPVLVADKGVLLEMLEPASSGWVKVKHRDGVAGFVKAGDVWGE